MKKMLLPGAIIAAAVLSGVLMYLGAYTCHGADFTGFRVGRVMETSGC